MDREQQPKVKAGSPVIRPEIKAKGTFIGPGQKDGPKPEGK